MTSTSVDLLVHVNQDTETNFKTACHENRENPTDKETTSQKSDRGNIEKHPRNSPISERPKSMVIAWFWDA